MEGKTTIVIPSKTEKFLEQTTRDILAKAEGDIEIFVVLDGYDLPENEVVKDPRVTYIRLEASRKAQKRHGINKAIAMSTGTFVMSVDAHCMFDQGFDTKLKQDHQPNWIQIPRRHRLDAENWCLQTQCDNRPPIDYEYIIWEGIIGDHSIHGFKWDQRTLDRKDFQIDDTITFQGSCWFMTREWYDKMGFMKTEGYTGWGQEAEELSFETWKNGGRVVTNKNTWYAHLHKGEKYGRMYWMSRSENRESYAYSFDLWIHKNREDFINMVKRFPRMPHWPDNWEEKLRKL